MILFTLSRGQINPGITISWINLGTSLVPALNAGDVNLRIALPYPSKKEKMLYYGHLFASTEGYGIIPLTKAVTKEDNAMVFILDGHTDGIVKGSGGTFLIVQFKGTFKFKGNLFYFNGKKVLKYK